MGVIPSYYPRGTSVGKGLKMSPSGYQKNIDFIIFGEQKELFVLQNKKFGGHKWKKMGVKKG